MAACFALTTTTAAEEERRPNIVMILADDLGWSDNTLYGTTSLYQTPNLERLAERGFEIEARSAQTNTASLSWISGRIGSDEFVQQPPAEFSLTAGKLWQTLSSEIRAEQSVPMIRLFLSAEGKPPIELRSIRLIDQGGRVEEFRFAK